MQPDGSDSSVFISCPGRLRRDMLSRVKKKRPKRGLSQNWKVTQESLTGHREEGDWPRSEAQVPVPFFHADGPRGGYAGGRSAAGVFAHGPSERILGLFCRHGFK